MWPGICHFILRSLFLVNLKILSMIWVTFIFRLKMRIRVVYIYFLKLKSDGNFYNEKENKNLTTNPTAEISLSRHATLFKEIWVPWLVLIDLDVKKTAGVFSKYVAHIFPNVITPVFLIPSASVKWCLWYLWIILWTKGFGPYGHISKSLLTVYLTVVKPKDNTVFTLLPSWVMYLLRIRKRSYKLRFGKQEGCSLAKFQLSGNKP